MTAVIGLCCNVCLDETYGMCRFVYDSPSGLSESVYPDIETAIGNRIGARIPGCALLTPLLSWQIKPRAGVSVSWLNPALRAQAIEVPALVLSGTEHTQTTVEDTHKLFNALAGAKQLHLFDGLLMSICIGTMRSGINR